MTRASKSPVKRIVSDGDGGEFVAEIEDRILTLRPLRSRKGGEGEVSVPWGAIYLRAMVSRVEEKRRLKKRGRHALGMRS